MAGSPRFARVGRFLVQLDSPPAVHYFNDALRIPYSLAGRLLAALPGPGLHARDRQDVDGVPAEVGEFFATLGIEPVPCVLLVDYAAIDRARTIGFLFRDAAPLPSAVVKLRRLPSGGTSLAHEADAHRRLHAAIPEAMRATVPAVIESTTRADVEVLMLSTLPGRSAYRDLQTSLRPSRFVDAHFDGAARWLAGFHEATRSGDLSASHGDFWARNLLLSDDGRVGVVDWELFALAESPFFDLFHFPLTYGLSYPWIRYQRLAPEKAFAKTFLETNGVSRAVRRYLKTYAAMRQISPQRLEEAFRRFLATRGTMRDAPPADRGTASLPWTTLEAQYSRANASVFSG
jgi:hypothetical protein